MAQVPLIAHGRGKADLGSDNVAEFPTTGREFWQTEFWQTEFWQTDTAPVAAASRLIVTVWPPWGALRQACDPNGAMIQIRVANNTLLTLVTLVWDES